MKYFETFAGVGGFSLGITNAYDMGNQPAIAQPEQTEPNADVRLWEREAVLEVPRGNGGIRTVVEVGRSVLSADNGRERPVCLGFSELDRYASDVLRYHYPETKNYGDIRSINERALPDFDLLVGGFPCQTFSVAGKRKGFEDTRGTLFFEMARIAKEKKPKFWLAENVKGLVSHDGGRTLQTILATMQELGYAVTYEVINAKNYNVPQNRERIFIFGTHIPTIWREALKDGQPEKMESFEKITKGFLFQLLLNNSAEVQKLQGHASKDLVCGLLVLDAIIELGRKQKFSYSGETSKNLYELFAPCSLAGLKELFTTKQGRLDEKQDTLDGILCEGASSYPSAEEKLWRSIALLLNGDWVEKSQATNKCITSTLITLTTGMETFTYATMLRTIASFTLLLRDSSNRLWNEVLSSLIIIREGTNYEPITSQNAEKIVGRSGFIRRSNLPAAFRGLFFIECGTRTGSPREIFFERQGGAGDTDERTADESGEGPETSEQGVRQDGLESDRTDGRGGQAYTPNPRIRRLMPLETERLMSWPDGWTRYGRREDGTVYEISDTQRYKMCGNGVVSKVVEELIKQHIL